MIWKAYLRDNQDLMYQTEDFEIGLTEVDWRRLKVRNTKKAKVGVHGSLVWPVYIEGRTIQINGIILSKTRAWLSKAMDFLDTLFSIPAFPTDPELKVFRVIDEQDRTWDIEAYVDDSISYSIEDGYDHVDGSTRRYSVSLYAPEPKFYSWEGQEVTVDWSEGNFGGIQFPVQLPIQLNKEFNPIEINALSNAEEPLTITITCTNPLQAPVFIYNASIKSSFIIDADFEVWDVIQINTKQRSLTKNGVSILGKRRPGSDRPVVKGHMEYLIYDRSWGLLGSDFTVQISYQDTLT